jgi:hypothetical protein
MNSQALAAEPDEPPLNADFRAAPVREGQPRIIRKGATMFQSSHSRSTDPVNAPTHPALARTDDRPESPAHRSRLACLCGSVLEPCIWSVWFDQKEKRPL